MGPVSKSRSEKVKYIDDGTVAVSVDLKESLIRDPVDRPRPLKYRERTGHILPAANNLLQFYVKDAEDFIDKNDMKINKKKTNIMLFNNARKFDFPPELTFDDGTPLEVISEVKLVGIILSNNLKWQKNTEYITKKAMKKM